MCRNLAGKSETKETIHQCSTFVACNFERKAPERASLRVLRESEPMGDRSPGVEWARPRHALALRCRLAVFGVLASSLERLAVTHGCQPKKAKLHNKMCQTKGQQRAGQCNSDPQSMSTTSAASHAILASVRENRLHWLQFGSNHPPVY